MNVMGIGNAKVHAGLAPRVVAPNGGDRCEF